MAAIPFPTVTGQSLDPDPLLAERQRTEPTFKIQPAFGGECWLVTRHADVRAMLGDSRFSRAATVDVDVARTQPYIQRAATIVGMDPPDHTRIRTLVSNAFTIRRVDALRPRAQQVVDGLLDDMEKAGSPVDVVAGLATPLPIAMICELLGVPFEDRSRFRGWADTFMTSTGHTVEQVMAAHGELTAYLAEMIDQRRHDATDDLLGALVHARDEGHALSEDELVQLGIALLVGGFETTTSQIAKFVLCLLLNPDQLRLLRDDPSLVPSAVEELLRLVPLAAGTAIAYVALEDVVLGGVTIRAGDAVTASSAAASRDPAVFTQPDELEVQRADNPHLGFGHGRHFCLGAHLARMELQVALGSLVQRFPKLELAVSRDDIAWKTGSAVWGLQSLPVSF